ncbi:cytochrome b561 and DOMON domain-containing protein At5g47530-like [Neltuma alba]|uniref:cytochrome b561 and DOMON domain-containing protein At5g47530-like n=1 Tax=Neltuma alba TaxID=207710 RepID=UPI0010A30BF4|nr:cytochrome b561 and DOMON domain-containing protein At5g47530-like [Prosopis alba]
MDSFRKLRLFLFLFFSVLTITSATPQPQPQSCNDSPSLLACNYHSFSSSSNSKFQIPENSTLINDDAFSAGPNISSSSQIDFVPVQVSNDDNENSDNSENSIRKVHGILSGIGWGILMPIGAMMARYLRAFEATESSWFNLHMACQVLAYLTGTTGLALGIYIGIMSEQFSVHGYIGFAIFFASTFQIVLALNYRPKEDDKDRIFWNIFHYVVGYGVIVLAIFDMFKGFSISSSYHGTWKNAYFGIIVSLGCVAFILEVTTWFLVCKNRKKKEEEEEEDENSDDNNI